jgi:hypothetical protein
VITRRFGLFFAVLSGCFAAGAIAEPISVPNYSFENPDVADGTASSSIPDWIFSSGPFGPISGGAHDQLNAQYAATTGNNAALPGAAAAGQDAFINIRPDPPASSFGALRTSITDTTIAANTRYLLTVAVGNRLDADPGLVTLSLIANGTVSSSQTILPANIPNGTFTDFSTTLGPLAPGDSRIGGALGIELRMDTIGGIQQIEANFDNVRLEASVIPEPSGVALLPVSAVAILLRRRR